MAGKYPVTGEQRDAIDAKMGELKRQLRQREGCRVDPKWMDDALQAIVEGRGFSDFLINGMFLQTGFQLKLVKRLSLECTWGFTEADFAQLGPAPAWPTDSKLAVVILDVSLADVATTFDTAWNLAKSVQPNQWRWGRLLSDSDHLRLLAGKTHQRGLRWRIVDLGANTNRKPIDVRSAATSPDSAILWMALYSPKWIWAQNGSTVPYVWLPGYEVSIPGYEPWTFVPDLNWDRDGRRIRLDACDAVGYDGSCAVPVVRESPK